MELDKINTYFPVDFRCQEKGQACFHIFPETELTTEKLNEIAEAAEQLWHKYFPMCMSTAPHASVVRIDADYQYCDKKVHDEIVESFLRAFNNISGIRKVIINDGETVNEEEDSEMDSCTDESDTYDDFEWDEILGLNKLALSYTAHAAGMDGECFTYAVYFTDGTADEAKADAVRNAIRAFDFKLTNDDYIGYLDISEADGKILIYHDLGNVKPENGNKAIHGILLAMNSVQGIEKVIVNEDAF